MSTPPVVYINVFLFLVKMIWKLYLDFKSGGKQTEIIKNWCNKNKIELLKDLFAWKGRKKDGIFNEYATPEYENVNMYWIWVRGTEW